MKQASKSPERTKPQLTIKKFSVMSGIEQSTLRYWDDIGLFSPAHRNTDNGYRYYSPEQIIQVNFIKVLSNLGIPLKTIASVKENRSPEDTLKLMEQQGAVLDMEVNRLHEAYSTIRILCETVRQGINAPDIDYISVQTLKAMPIALGPRNDPWKGQDFYQGYISYCQYARENQINLDNPIGGYYDSLGQFLETPSAPARFFSVVPCGEDQRPAGKYIVGYAQGNYSQLENAVQRLNTFAARQELNANGPVFVLYLLDELSVKDPADYLAQVCVALDLPENESASGC